MANGTDSEDKFVVLSKIRTGLKREFEFALKVQSEICGSLGRTRSKKAQNNVVPEVDVHELVSVSVSPSPQTKKLKTYQSRRKKKEEKSDVNVKDLDKETGALSEEEAKSDVVDVVMDEVKVESCSNDFREVPNCGGVELMCEDEVEKQGEGKSEAEKAVVREKEVLESVEEGKVENHREEGEKIEAKMEVDGVEEEKNKECVEVVMDAEEMKSERMDEEREEETENAQISEEKEKNNDDERELVENGSVDGDLKGKESIELGVEGSTAVEPVVVGGDDDGKIAVEQVEDGGNEDGKTAVEPVEDGGNEDGKIAVEPAVVVGNEDKRIAVEPTVVGANDDGKIANGVVERPLRRFTRSLLQQVESAKNSPMKYGVNKGDLKEVGEEVTTPMKQESIKPRKVVRKFFTKLKDFLDSGILEGTSVKYIRGSKVRGPGVRGLQGVIRGCGILCYCGDCKAKEVVTPTVFELHAGSSNKRPPEYIYLDNGNTLRDVMNACKDSPLETLEETVRMVVGSSLKKSNFCLNCRGSIFESDSEDLVLLCNSCTELKESQAGSSGLTDSSDGSPEPPTSAQKSSNSAMKNSSSKSQGRVTRKDLRMHKLVFEAGGLFDGTELAYFVRGQKLLVGYKKGYGILCSCCKTEISPSQFEAHAGWASRRKPFQHIYTSNGVSLHELSIKLSQERRFSTKENDDLCGICMDGGNLLCCDSCPRAFHRDCVSLPRIPTGAWYCRYCQNTFQKEKFVEHNANAIAAGRVPGVDPMEQINNRCIRIVETPETELGGCVLCRGRDFCKSRFGRRTVILCDQCEREYHVGCLKDHGMEDLKELPKGKWLCCADCKKINAALQKLVDRGEEKLPDASLNVIKQKNVESGPDGAPGVDVRWRVLRGKKIEAADGTRVLLSKAVSIFHDRFDPIIESQTKLDLIPSMVYGRSHKGQDYHGMYCAILTVNQVVVSAGIFRIFGQELAELPLVATTTECQGQGYFQCLFSCFEKLLGFLDVKTLVLPSASEAQSIWTNKFGFNEMSQDEQNKYRNDYPMMVFQGTSMLQKPVPKCRVVG